MVSSAPAVQAKSMTFALDLFLHQHVLSWAFDGPGSGVHDTPLNGDGSQVAIHGLLFQNVEGARLISVMSATSFLYSLSGASGSPNISIWFGSRSGVTL